jgi:hypothetical protein
MACHEQTNGHGSCIRTGFPSGSTTRPASGSGYRPVHPNTSRLANVVRLRVPTKACSDCQRPKAGYRCRNAVSSVAVMLLEMDSTTLPHQRSPHLMCDARCPFRGQLMRLSYDEIIELVAVEGG